MPKFNIEIELEISDGNCCNGCKFLVKYPESQRCDIFKETIIANYIRPEICKEQNKEKTK